MKYSKKKIESLLSGIYDGSITEYDLPEDLYYAIGNYLQEAVYKGYGKSLDNAIGKDYELLSELHDNVWMFSAAKTYQEVLDIRSYLTDADGNIRSVQEFNKLGRAAFSNWNDNYGRTEYVTAIGQAQSAESWKQIEEQQDILPILEFDTNGVPCPKCKPFDGFTAPVKDKVWNWLMPLLHFNCQCIVRQRGADYPIKSLPNLDELKGTVPEAFQMNAGKDKYIFSPEHPYFQVEKKDVKFAQQNFNLPIPEKPKSKKEEVVPKPKKGKIEKRTKEEQINDLKVKLKNSLGISVDNNIQVDSDLTNESFTKRVNQLNKLLDEYKIDGWKGESVQFSFKSNKDANGTVTTSKSGRILFDVNFGSNSGKDRKQIIDVSMFKSRCEKSNQEISTLTHEFGHIISKQSQKDLSPHLNEFWTKVEKLESSYMKDLKTSERSKVFLGRYASTNTNEFMAEAFTEYKLSKTPSKYASEVGKLIDKYFKK